MAERLDLTGRTFGRWTVVQALPSPGGGAKTRWFCVCACGTGAEVRTSHLLAGESQSCGCHAREVMRQRRPWQRRNLKGLRIGQLVVLRASVTNLPPTSRSRPGGPTAWICRCDCGREVIIATRDLTRRHRPTSSCGCTHLKPSAPTMPPTGHVAPARAEGRHTISAEELRAFREKHAPPPPKYRRVAWSVEEDHRADDVAHDFDPFDR
jgi:hypothetical protein